MSPDVRPDQRPDLAPAEDGAGRGPAEDEACGLVQPLPLRRVAGDVRAVDDRVEGSVREARPRDGRVAPEERAVPVLAVREVLAPAEQVQLRLILRHASP